MTEQINESTVLAEFLEWLNNLAIDKSKLYDGSRNELSVDETIRYAVEKLGEVSTAVSRARWGQAKAECIDLAHIAFLIYLAIKREDKSNGKR